MNAFENSAECLKMFGASDVAEAAVTRKDRFIKIFMLYGSPVCDIFAICR